IEFIDAPLAIELDGMVADVTRFERQMLPDFPLDSEAPLEHVRRFQVGIEVDQVLARIVVEILHLRDWESCNGCRGERVVPRKAVNAGRTRIRRRGEESGVTGGCGGKE